MSDHVIPESAFFSAEEKVQILSGKCPGEVEPLEIKPANSFTSSWSTILVVTTQLLNVRRGSVAVRVVGVMNL